MKSSKEDEVEGKVKELKGNFKEQVGKLTNDPDLESEGRVDKTGGKIQQKIGEIKKVFDK